jgi:hypothetical protein
MVGVTLRFGLAPIVVGVGRSGRGDGTVVVGGFGAVVAVVEGEPVPGVEPPTGVVVGEGGAPSAKAVKLLSAPPSSSVSAATASAAAARAARVRGRAEVELVGSAVVMPGRTAPAANGYTTA